MHPKGAGARAFGKYGRPAPGGRWGRIARGRPKGAARRAPPESPAPATSFRHYRPHHRFFPVQRFAVTRAIARRCAWFYAAACFLFNRERLNHCISIGSSVRFRRSHHASPMCIGSGASKHAIFPAGLPQEAGGVRIPIHPSCRATRRECTGVTSVHQVCHFNLTFGLFGSARHHRMFIANDFLIAGEEDLCLPSKVMDFEAKHKERALGQPGPFICLRHPSPLHPPAPPPSRDTRPPIAQHPSRPSRNTLPPAHGTLPSRVPPFPPCAAPFPPIAQHTFPHPVRLPFPIACDTLSLLARDTLPPSRATLSPIARDTRSPSRVPHRASICRQSPTRNRQEHAPP